MKTFFFEMSLAFKGFFKKVCTFRNLILAIVILAAVLTAPRVLDYLRWLKEVDATTVDVGIDNRGSSFDPLLDDHRILWIVLPTPDGKGRMISWDHPRWSEYLTEYINSGRYRLAPYYTGQHHPREDPPEFVDQRR